MPAGACKYFYNNGRYVRNRTMMAGMEMAFKGTTMQGKFPWEESCFWKCPSDLVDVNVHPAKTEVRFARENDIFDLVYTPPSWRWLSRATGERNVRFRGTQKQENNEKSNITEKDENSSEKYCKEKQLLQGFLPLFRGRQSRVRWDTTPKRPLPWHPLHRRSRLWLCLPCPSPGSGRSGHPAGAVYGIPQ